MNIMIPWRMDKIKVCLILDYLPVFFNFSEQFKYWAVKLCVYRGSDAGQYKLQTPSLEICKLNAYYEDSDK